MQKFGFELVDRISEEYELWALSFDDTKPVFAENAKKMAGIICNGLSSIL